MKWAIGVNGMMSGQGQHKDEGRIATTSLVNFRSLVPWLIFVTESGVTSK